jgi:hypothetical protein
VIHSGGQTNSERGCGGYGEAIRVNTAKQNIPYRMVMVNKPGKTSAEDRVVPAVLQMEKRMQ